MGQASSVLRDSGQAGHGPNQPDDVGHPGASGEVNNPPGVEQENQSEDGGFSSSFGSGIIPSSSRRRRRRDSSDEALSSSSTSRPRRRHRTSALRRITQFGSSVMSWGGQQHEEYVPSSESNSLNAGSLSQPSRNGLSTAVPRRSAAATGLSLGSRGSGDLPVLPVLPVSPVSPVLPVSSELAPVSESTAILESSSRPAFVQPSTSSLRLPNLFSSSGSDRTEAPGNNYNSSRRRPFYDFNYDASEGNNNSYEDDHNNNTIFRPLSRSSRSGRESLFNLQRSLSSRSDNASIRSSSTSPTNMIHRRRHRGTRGFGSDIGDTNGFEGQTAMLSRLLAVAASVTASSLVGSSRSNTGVAYGRPSPTTGNQNRQTTGNRGDSANTLQDDSFQGFLNGLSNGLLAHELTNNSGNNNNNDNYNEDSSSTGDTNRNNNSDSGNRSSRNFFRMFRFPPSEDESNADDSETTSSLVPVLIVGVRAVDNTDDHDNGDLPFFDASSSRTNNSHPDQNGDNLNNDTTNATIDGLETPTVPSAPSNTPHNNTRTPSPPGWRANRRDELLDELFGSAATGGGGGGGSAIPMVPPSNTTASSTSSPLDSTTTSPPSPAAASAGSSRRMNRQSWIVYVVGGSYPQDHPILLAPSLFTDNPTYEDLLILENFLGQASPPVASKADVLSSGGVSVVESENATDKAQVTLTDKCLVCLSYYECGEECRQLKNCGHIFHRECIDQWLTTGRNSCPLCRGEGVTKVADDNADSAATC